MTSTPTDAPALPAEVQRLISAIAGVPGVSSVGISRIYLPDLELSDLSLPGPYGDLPAAALRRSGGGLPEETLITVSFQISRNEMGLWGLEFLAWWVRDRARAGHNVQLRAIGLPPMAGGTEQLGSTLSFSIDMFHENPTQDVALMLKALDDAAASAETFTRLYEEAFAGE